MHLKWLEGVLALAKAPSLTEAAQARRVTQPAFSRRLRSLEAWLGSDVVDRSHKSGSLSPAVKAHLDQIEALVQGFQRLKRDLGRWKRTHGRLVLVAPHSLATTVLPRLVVCLGDNEAVAELRVRAADLDECHTMLNDGEADILVAYQAASTKRTPVDCDHRIQLAADHLIAVAAPAVASSLAQLDRVDAVTYPANVFFGALVHRGVFPAIRSGRGLRIRCETALASGVMELVLAELGVGWLPRLLAEENIKSSRLIDVTHILGGVPLDIVATRTQENTNPLMGDAWRALSSTCVQDRPTRLKNLGEI